MFAPIIIVSKVLFQTKKNISLPVGGICEVIQIHGSVRNKRKKTKGSGMET